MMCCFGGDTARGSTGTSSVRRERLLPRLPARTRRPTARRWRRGRRPAQAAERRPARGLGPHGRALSRRRAGGRSHPRVLGGLRARRRRTDDHVARRRPGGRQRRAAGIVRDSCRRPARSDHRRRDLGDRAARRCGRRRVARAAGRSQSTRGRPQEGDVLAGQRARRTRAGDAPARAQGGPERRGPEGAVFGVSQSNEPGAHDCCWASRAPTPARASASEAIFWLAQKAGQQGRRRHHRAHRAGSRHRGQETRRLRPQPDAEGRRRPAADQRRAHEHRTPPCASRRCSGSASPRIRGRWSSSRRY